MIKNGSGYTKAIPWIIIALSYAFVSFHRIMQFEGIFNLTADDNLYQLIWLSNQTLSFVKSQAIHHGRIYYLLNHPITIFASGHMHEMHMNILNMITFWLAPLCFIYLFKHITNKFFTAFFLIVYWSVLPLWWDSMPPISYPLMFYYPFIALFLAAWTFKQTQSCPKSILKYIYFSISILCFLLSIATYEALTLLNAFLFFIYGITYSFPKNQVSKKDIKQNCYNLIPYGICLTGYMALYFCFRIIHPSIYEGNTAEGLHNYLQIFRTIYFHSLSGISISHIFLGRLDFSGLWPASLWQIISSFTGGLLTGLSVYFCIRRASSFGTYRFGFFILVGILIIFMSTILLAVTEKYQTWATQFSGYIDSRFAYFGIILILSAFCFYISKCSRINRQIIAIAISLLIAVNMGMSNVMTTEFNRAVRAQMLDSKKPWHIAKSLLEEIPEDVSKDNIKELLKAHPQLKNIPWSPYWNTVPGYTVADYWFYYFTYLKKNSQR